MKSQMVMASKYELEVKVKGSTAYKKDGQKTLIHGNKFIPRRWVEERNLHENNELYVIDEEATKEAYIMREQSIIDNAKRDKRDKTSMADLVEAFAPKKKKKKKKEKATNSESEIDTIKAELKEKGIKFHHMAGINKLKELNK